MVSIKSLAILLFSAIAVDAAGVVGKAEGFAALATGGGTAAPAIPANINELVTWLSDDVPRTIILDKTWDFTGSMGQMTEKGCTPASSKCTSGAQQDAIDYNGWCKQNSNQAVAQPTVTYDVVALNRNAIKIELNPKYIWGGDAIAVDGTDLLWIDHVKISRVGRQHITMGPAASNRVTVSNSEFDGTTEWSVKCNNKHYWTLYFTGSKDTVTFKGNYVHSTSGRGPKVGGLASSVEPNVFFHAANNYWQNISGNAFQLSKGAKVLAEGNQFENTTKPIDVDTDAGSKSIWTSSTDAAACTPIIGRPCLANSLVSSGPFAGSNQDVLTTAKTMALSPVVPATNVKAMVLQNAVLPHHNSILRYHLKPQFPLNLFAFIKSIHYLINGMSTDKITFLMNWHATPYHAPVYLAQKLGYFADEGIKVALLEPNDPSDVTEIIGSGKVDMGFKAMIHTLAAKARGFPVTSIGSLLDEPFTGVVYLKDSGITTDFRSLNGKKIGYVGEFGKIQIDELTKHYGMQPTDYEANVQMVELEEWLANQGRPRSDVQMLRIDELAELGCCCFCSILYIANDTFMAQNPEKIRKFIKAVKRATDHVLASPTEAYKTYVDIKPEMASSVNRKIFERSYAYFSKDLKNVQRDWEKVTKYGKRLGVLGEDFHPNYTNEFLDWKLEGDSADPTGDQKRMIVLQREVADNGGFKRLNVNVAA
ncbi:hypothetical protein EYC84_001557 [Monilinia fructicola]|uniref:Thiamine pyrimidine synthase n=1 Tax=Monilinia fructicola TaxID=38448 RepID=A0A5M9JU04_MONFR|nr:hypothetical protein EYC84_001557 [Monilinia fructicola]